MVNTDDFIKRLEQILDYYSLSASGFADKINVQRSSLSHLLSGRNKPSLDFIVKILEVFPEIDLYWILNGKGTFPKTNFIEIPIAEELKKEVTPTPIVEEHPIEKIFSEKSIKTGLNTEVEKIVVFYKNGTFAEYSPK